MLDQLKILILDDERGGVQHLHEALSSCHSLTWTRTIDVALNELDRNGEPFDLIICGTHLISESMFEFLQRVKHKTSDKKTAFICFRSATTDFAKKFDSSIEQTAKLLGAVAYISVPEVSDPTKLREMFEAEIEPLLVKV